MISLPANSDQLANLITALFGGLKAQKDSADTASIAAAYMIALDEYSYPVISKAVKLLLRGEAEGFSKTFLPSSAELASLCKKITNATNGTIKFYERLLKVEEEKPIKNKLTAGKMAQIQAQFKESVA